MGKIFLWNEKKNVGMTTVQNSKETRVGMKDGHGINLCISSQQSLHIHPRRREQTFFFFFWGGGGGGGGGNSIVMRGKHFCEINVGMTTAQNKSRDEGWKWVYSVYIPPS